MKKTLKATRDVKNAVKATADIKKDVRSVKKAVKAAGVTAEVNKAINLLMLLI